MSNCKFGSEAASNEEQLVMRDHGRRSCPVELGQLLGGRYRIIAKLGHGGWSTSWLARDMK